MRSPQQNTITWFREFGGVCQAPVGESVPPGLFADGLNYEVNTAGELVPRKGASTLGVAGDLTAVRSIFPADFDGTIRILVATDQSVYEVTKDGLLWTKLVDIDVAGDRVTFALLNSQDNPVVVFGNGAMPLRKWDGTTVSACGGSAPPGRPFAWKGYCGVFGISGLPGRVQFNFFKDGISDPDVWLVDDTPGTERFLEMQGTVTSCFPCSAGLLVFGPTRTELFTGDPDNPGALSLLSETTGNSCHEATADAGGATIWMSRTGINVWDGGSSFPSARISTPTNPKTSNIGTDFPKIDPSMMAYAAGVFLPERRAYLFSASKFGDGHTPVRSWIYLFDRGAWFPWSLSATALAVYSDPELADVGLVGTAGGSLLSLDGTLENKDGGTEFEFWIQTGDLDMGLPDNVKIFRSIQIGFRGKGTRTFQVLLDSEAGRDEDTGTIAISPGGFRIGVNVVGDALSELQRYCEARVPISTRAKHFAIKFYGSTYAHTVALSCFALEWRPDSRRYGLLQHEVLGTGVQAIPVVRFIYTPSSPTLGETVTLTNTTQGKNGISSWKWTIDGTVISTSENTTTTFDELGDHTVILTGYRLSGPPITCTRTITVPASVCGFTLSSASQLMGTAVTCTNTTTNQGSVASWSWDVDGVEVGTSLNLTTTIIDRGAHTITLTATLEDGSTITHSETYTATEPVLAFTPPVTDPVQYAVFSMANETSAADKTAVSSWSWELDGVEVLTTEDWSDSIDTAGAHTVTLTGVLIDGLPPTTPHSHTITATAAGFTSDDWDSVAALSGTPQAFLNLTDGVTTICLTSSGKVYSTTDGAAWTEIGQVNAAIGPTYPNRGGKLYYKPGSPTTIVAEYNGYGTLGGAGTVRTEWSESTDGGANWTNTGELPDYLYDLFGDSVYNPDTNEYYGVTPRQVAQGYGVKARVVNGTTFAISRTSAETKVGTKCIGFGASTNGNYDLKLFPVNLAAPNGPNQYFVSHYGSDAETGGICIGTVDFSPTPPTISVADVGAVAARANHGGMTRIASLPVAGTRIFGVRMGSESFKILNLSGFAEVAAHTEGTPGATERVYDLITHSTADAVMVAQHGYIFKSNDLVNWTKCGVWKGGTNYGRYNSGTSCYGIFHRMTSGILVLGCVGTSELGSDNVMKYRGTAT